MAIYPGHLAMVNNGTLNPKIPVTKDTPPTFLLMAGDDHVDGVEQALAYYTARRPPAFRPECTCMRKVATPSVRARRSWRSTTGRR
ncbi:MAG: hypothetical protein U1F20_04155 [Lysobacterales bacterium]